MGEVGKICTSEQRVSSLNMAGVRGQYDRVLAQHEREAGKGKGQTTLSPAGPCRLVTASLQLAWVCCKNYSAQPISRFPFIRTKEKEQRRKSLCLSDTYQRKLVFLGGGYCLFAFAFYKLESEIPTNILSSGALQFIHIPTIFLAYI